MTPIQLNIAKHKAALDAVRDHPMCYRMIRDGGKVTVIYPPGDFQTDGARSDDTARGLERLLAVMERHWVASGL